MGMMSWGHWAIVALIIMLLFGRNLFSSVMGDLAKGIKELKDIHKEEK